MPRVEPLFAAPHLRLVVRSAIAGNARARVWADSPDSPRAALLWDGGHCLYLAGEGRHAGFAGSLPDLLAMIAAEAAAARLHYFTVSVSDSSWDGIVCRLLPDLRRRERRLLRLDLASVPREYPIPEGFTLEPIGRELLDAALATQAISSAPATRLRNAEYVRGEIASMWPSIDRFLSQAFGVVVRRGDEVVCWCTTEYASAGECGVGIETIREWQGRGLATAATGAVLAECRARGLTPHWDCWLDNYPSRRVAEKSEFEPVCDYYVHFGDVLRVGSATS